MRNLSVAVTQMACGANRSANIATAAGLGLWGTNRSWAGANNRVRIAVVGIRGHGFGSHIRNYPLLPDVEVTALCDVDENLFPERLKWFEQNDRPIPKTYVDIRKLLEDTSIDAISAVLDVESTTNMNAAIAKAIQSLRRSGVTIAAAALMATPNAMMPPSVFLCVQRPDQAPGCSNVMRPMLGARSPSANDPAIRTMKPPARTFSSDFQS